MNDVIVNKVQSIQRMVGFRNTVIHEYQQVDVQIVEAVISTGLDDLLAFAQLCLGRAGRR